MKEEKGPKAAIQEALLATDAIGEGKNPTFRRQIRQMADNMGLSRQEFRGLEADFEEYLNERTRKSAWEKKAREIDAKIQARMPVTPLVAIPGERGAPGTPLTSRDWMEAEIALADYAEDRERTARIDRDIARMMASDLKEEKKDVAIQVDAPPPIEDEADADEMGLRGTFMEHEGIENKLYERQLDDVRQLWYQEEDEPPPSRPNYRSILLETDPTLRRFYETFKGSPMARTIGTDRHRWRRYYQQMKDQRADQFISRRALRATNQQRWRIYSWWLSRYGHHPRNLRKRTNFLWNVMNKIIDPNNNVEWNFVINTLRRSPNKRWRDLGELGQWIMMKQLVGHRINKRIIMACNILCEKNDESEFLEAITDLLDRLRESWTFYNSDRGRYEIGNNQPCQQQYIRLTQQDNERERANFLELAYRAQGLERDRSQKIYIPRSIEYPDGVVY